MMKTNKINVIIYSEDTMQAYEATPINFEIKKEFPYLEITTIDSISRKFMPCNPLESFIMDSCEVCKAKLDPTTMERIARYNLEKTNEGLIKKIRFKQKILKGLNQEFERQKRRLSDLQQVMKQFISSNSDTVSEMFGIDEYDYCENDED